MNLSEEEFQKKAESGKVDPTDADMLAYQRVFSALNKRPNMRLSPDFADKVVGKIASRKSGGWSPEFLWFGLGVLVLLGGLVYTLPILMEYIEFQTHFGFLSSLLEMKWLFAIGALMIAVFNWLDKRLFSHQ